MTDVTSFPVSNKDTSIMMVLGLTQTQTLFYDNADSENFFVLVKSADPWSPGWSSGFGIPQQVLYAVSPLFASQWFQSNANGIGLRTIYNPFAFTTQRKISNLV